ncbi:MAG: hypothetical protein JXP34_13810 [Planctomycetes bacterium]|nr:hypothetical protein [Planctomycetota bacterium]
MGGEDVGYIFREVAVRSPMDELAALFEKKIKTFRNLGEDEKVRLYREAYEIARRHLLTVLGEEG